MNGTTEYKTQLSGAALDAIAGRVERYLTEQGLPRRDVLRLRLTMTELLLRLRDERGRNTVCVLTLGGWLGRPLVQLSYAGAPFDPTVIYRESDGEAWSEQLLAGFGLIPAWSWRRGVNRLVLQPPRKPRNGWLGPGLAALLAAALGFAGRAADAAWTERVTALVLEPLFTAFFDAVGLFAGLMLFFSVVCVLCGVGDTLTFGRIGKLAPLRFIGLTLLWSSAGAAVLPLLFRSLRYEKAGWGIPRPEMLVERLCALIPRDPLTPFRDGALWQILFLAVLTGLAFLSLGERIGRLREWAGACRLFLVSVLERVCALRAPLVFVTLLRLLWSGALPSVLRLWKPLAVCVLCTFVVPACKLGVSCLTLKVSAGRLVKPMLPACRLALSTASPAAAFGLLMDNCETRLGLSHRLVLLALPIGGVLCAPVDALCYSAAALYCAEAGGVPLSAAWLLALLLLSAVLCLTLPPIRGAHLMGFGLLLAQLGLPAAEGLAAMALLHVFIDALGAAARAAYLPMELMMQAQKLDMRNEAALRQ